MHTKQPTYTPGFSRLEIAPVRFGRIGLPGRQAAFPDVAAI
jgi:hypothetical protein